jgi:hypothetical protein
VVEPVQAVEQQWLSMMVAIQLLARQAELRSSLLPEGTHSQFPAVSMHK